ncbi:hypothetical protein Mal15_32110 [Stieleria maiorica]|uniref:Uncharacterized protein n=1 Tax=Stieleria maiorica TaxID=2795974 RepID=A0A5B9MD05_9BACT|nr:hypothetical protein [Stieleria maiorica]QEF99151.1 hypothetical protein Mal15_32110 [Stieleria maiorica]
MDFYVAKSTYNTSGGSCLYGYAGDLLTAHIDDYGTAIKEIEVVACLRSKTRKFRPTLEGLFDQFHAYIDSLPRITFQRKNKRVKIEFRSEHFTADDEESRNATPEQQMTAADEVAQALAMLRKRIKPSDDFDVERFLAHASKVLATKIENPVQSERVRQAAIAKRLAIRDAKSPWERLEIEWERFHPNARDILDEPYYWECADDLAPNGNDTGADLLEDFRRWNKKHPRTSPIKFLDGLIKAWGIDPIDWDITDRAVVAQLDADQPIPLNVCNEAAIALAFSVIKVRGTCPPDVAERGLAAITRTETLVHRSRLDQSVKKRWDLSLAKLRSKLASFTP